MSALAPILCVVVTFLLAVILFLLKRWKRSIDDYRWLEEQMAKRSEGIVLIEAERKRQISEEGWTAEHDDREHAGGELADSAACYAMYHQNQTPFRGRVINTTWPWEHRFWKPSGVRVNNMVKAGALIAAEIDRLQRAEKRISPEEREFAKGNHENCNVPNLHRPFCQCASESEGGK